MTNRMPQVNAELQKAISTILSQNIEVPFEYMISIIQVDCAPSLRTAKIYVSVLPFNKKDEGLGFLIRQKNEIRGLLGKKIHLKFTPDLTFIFDDREEFADQIYTTLDEIRED